MRSTSVSVSVPLPAPAAQRFENESERLLLPVSMVLNRSIEEVARLIQEGWRPKAVPPPGRVFLFLNLARSRKGEFEEIVGACGLKFLDVARLAAWAALLKMEAGDQVAWPLKFTKRELAVAVDCALKG